MSKNILQGLNDFRVLTFDCYGTLIDWETGIWDAFQPLISSNGRSDILRKDALEAFATFENHQEVETPAMAYPEVLARVHGAVAAHFGLQTTARLDSDLWP